MEMLQMRSGEPTGEPTGEHGNICDYFHNPNVYHNQTSVTSII